MKKLIFLFLILFPTIAFSETIQLEWDYSAEDQAKIDGFKLYMKEKWKDAFDYTDPIATLDPADRSTSIDAPTKAGAVQTYDFVIKAYKDDLESADSNTASYAVVGVKPLTPTGLMGQYDKELSIISLSWEQPLDPYDIHKWIVYYQVDPAAGFLELGQVDKDQQLNLTTEFSGVAEGEIKNVTFTVVSFRRDYTVYSDNSESLIIEIDRSGPPVPPENLKINIEIPVP